MSQQHTIKVWKRPTEVFGIVVDVDSPVVAADERSRFECRSRPSFTMPSGVDSFLGIRQLPADFERLPSGFVFDCDHRAVGQELVARYRSALPGWTVEHEGVVELD